MPRTPRVQEEGGVVHVTARGNNRGRILRDQRDKLLLLDALERAVVRFGWRCHAYCVMGTHYHLLLQTPEPNLSSGMHWLNLRFARRHNRRHGRTGHVFERRFHSERVDSERHFLAAARYIVRNPVRAGLCDHPSQWPWSSYRATAGERHAPDFLTTAGILELLGPTAASARAAYATWAAGEDDRTGTWYVPGTGGVAGRHLASPAAAAMPGRAR
ncbi:MAG TPA: transposase [Gaiellaceae bacterium]|nr:transposase [Gaiellaceae bacterium]